MKKKEWGVFVSLLCSFLLRCYYLLVLHSCVNLFVVKESVKKEKGEINKVFQYYIFFFPRKKYYIVFFFCNVQYYIVLEMSILIKKNSYRQKDCEVWILKFCSSIELLLVDGKIGLWVVHWVFQTKIYIITVSHNRSILKLEIDSTW